MPTDNTPTPYIALYRRLRPAAFRDVLDQDHIIRTLLNEINGSRISHAYLFCGTRGTGKTSTAKIFAKAINCYAPKEGEPCNECASCLAVHSQRSMNVIEIDAASNNGVENIRDIREEVMYPPTEGIYKVYIIDEVHMLSAGAFNALLKTLEEPPEHVVFILATTDPQKIPPTILSRCQRFDFRRITSGTMADAMRDYVNGEGVRVTDGALSYIAQAADGAMRDALSILDQCMAFYNDETITLDMVLDVLGSVDQSVYFALADALYRSDGAAAMEIIDGLIRKGRDAAQFVTGFISHLRNLLVCGSLGRQAEQSAVLDLSEESVIKLKRQSADMDQDTLVHFIHAFSELQGRLRYTSNARIFLEVTCLKLCSPQVEDSGETLFRRIKNLEDMVEKLTAGGIRPTEERSIAELPEAEAVSGEPEPYEPFAEAEPWASPEQRAGEKSIPPEIGTVMQNWSRLTGKMRNPVRSILEKAWPGYLNSGFLSIVCQDLASPKLLENKKDSIGKTIADVFGKEIPVHVMTLEEYESQHTKIYGASDQDMLKWKTGGSRKAGSGGNAAECELTREAFTDVFDEDIMENIVFE